VAIDLGSQHPRVLYKHTLSEAGSQERGHSVDGVEKAWPAGNGTRTELST